MKSEQVPVVIVGADGAGLLLALLLLQQRIHPMVIERVSYETELVDFAQDAEGVTGRCAHDREP